MTRVLVVEDEESFVEALGTDDRHGARCGVPPPELTADSEQPTVFWL